jgi:hypothetical protein
MEKIKNKNFLITGGTGFLGKNLIPYIEKYGGNVIPEVDTFKLELVAVVEVKEADAVPVVFISPQLIPIKPLFPLIILKLFVLIVFVFNAELSVKIIELFIAVLPVVKTWSNVSEGTTGGYVEPLIVDKSILLTLVIFSLFIFKFSDAVFPMVITSPKL